MFLRKCACEAKRSIIFPNTCFCFDHFVILLCIILGTLVKFVDTCLFFVEIQTLPKAFMIGRGFAPLGSERFLRLGLCAAGTIPGESTYTVYHERTLT